MQPTDTFFKKEINTETSIVAVIYGIRKNAHACYKI